MALYNLLTDMAVLLSGAFPILCLVLCAMWSVPGLQ